MPPKSRTNDPVAVSSIEEKGLDRLNSLLKKCTFEIKKGTENTVAYITAKDETDFIRLTLLLEIAGVDPFDNGETFTVQIGKYDILMLIEQHILDPLLIPQEVESDIMNGEGPVIAGHEKFSTRNYFSEIKSIPELFAKKGGTKSQFDDMTETEEGESDSYYSGNTSYLYSLYVKKYKRLPGGIVYKKNRVNGKIVEVEITEAEQDALLRAAQNGDQKARNEYLIMNIGLVYLVAFNRIQKFPKANLADLLQEALITMNGCIDRYKGKKNFDIKTKDEEINKDNEGGSGEEAEGIEEVYEGDSKEQGKFSTFAVTSMNLRLLKFVQDYRLVHIPHDLRNSMSKIATIAAKLKTKNGVVTDEDIIRTLATNESISYGSAERMYYKVYSQLRDEETVDIDTDLYDDALVDDSKTPEEALNDKKIERVVDEVLSTLTRRQEKVLRLRFGIGLGGEELSSREIGEHLSDKMTREGVRQIELKAIRRLKSRDYFIETSMGLSVAKSFTVKDLHKFLARYTTASSLSGLVSSILENIQNRIMSIDRGLKYEDPDSVMRHQYETEKKKLEEERSKILGEIILYIKKLPQPNHEMVKFLEISNYCQDLLNNK